MGYIPASIEKAEVKLRYERTDIENAMIEQIRRFQAKIDETKAAVFVFRDHDNQKKAKDYVQQIEEINKDLGPLKTKDQQLEAAKAK